MHSGIGLGGGGGGCFVPGTHVHGQGARKDVLGDSQQSTTAWSRRVNSAAYLSVAALPAGTNDVKFIESNLPGPGVQPA